MMMRAWQGIEGLDDPDALIGAVSDGTVHGRTTAEVAEALGLSIDGATLREALEALLRRFLGPPVPPRPPLDEPDEEGRAPGAVRTAR